MKEQLPFPVDAKQEVQPRKFISTKATADGREKTEGGCTLLFCPNLHSHQTHQAAPTCWLHLIYASCQIR